MNTPRSAAPTVRAQLELQREVIAQLEDERRRLQELLVDMPKLFATLEPGDLVPRVADTAVSLTQAQFALYVPSNDEHPPILAGLDPEDFAERPAPGIAPLLTVEPARSRVIPDVARWASNDAATRLYGTLTDGRLVRSWLVSPVRGRDGGLHGVLYLGHSRPHVFTSLHETHVDILSASLGLALDAADLAAERDRVLAALEDSLLPPLLPNVPGLEIAARYRPADDRSRVGGDFYDVFRAADDRWAIVIGDVCGSGPEAAAITGVARYTIRALATDHGPAATLARLNEILLGQASDGRFLTAILAEVSTGPDGIALTLANAGHPGAVLLRDDGTTELLDEGHGPLLGSFPGVGTVDERTTLDPGDAIVLYTDGVTEARDPARALYGTERLLELISICAGRTASGIARRIELDVLNFAAGTVDDVAILVARRSPTALP
jgi:sigma-B regulation protein RsbU (phosphoserine phosphatase)